MFAPTVIIMNLFPLFCFVFKYFPLLPNSLHSNDLLEAGFKPIQECQSGVSFPNFPCNDVGLIA